jgi:hypothetical protein
MQNTTKDQTICPVILNQTNLVAGNTNNNIYRYDFPGGAEFKNGKIAVSSISIYYSWENINVSNSNNTLSIIFPISNGMAGDTTATLSITFPDGTYSVSDMNEYLQSQMILNNYYLINSSSNYVYYIEIVENSVRYGIQLNCYPVPIAVPTGWTAPSATWGGVGLPNVLTNTPQLVVPSTNITTLLGYAAGTFPSSQQVTTQSFLSTSTPELSTVSSVIVGTSLVNNKLSSPRNVIYSFAPSGSYGDLISSYAYQYSWVDIVDGPTSSLDIILYDQNFSALQVIDTNIVIFMLIKM